MDQYIMTQWSTGKPITQELMNKIEKQLQATTSAIISDESTLSTANNNITVMQSALANHDNLLTLVRSDVATALTNAQSGIEALSEINNAKGWHPDSETFDYDSLAERFASLDSIAVNAYSRADAAFNEVVEARGVKKYGSGGSRPAVDLNDKLTNMESQIDENKSNISSSLDNYTNARGGYNTLQDRINAIDGDTANQGIFATKSLASHVQDVETELENAHHSEVYIADYNSLDARFEANEGLIKEIRDAHRDTNDTLDTRFDAIDNVGDASNRTHAYRIGALENEISNARQGQANLDARLDNIDTSISTINTNIGYNDLSSTETIQKKVTDAVSAAQTALETRINAIDNSSTGTVHGLDTRISALETEVDNANGNGTLDDRFDAIETSITTMATELNMLDNSGAMKTTQTRVDDLDAHVTSLATELGMISNGEIVDTNTRVDDLESRVSAMDDTSTGSIAALGSRMTTAEGDIDALETTVGDASSGLVQSVTALETTIGDASSGLVQSVNTATSNIETLQTTVGNLAEKDTIIVNAPVSGSNYTNGIPNLSSPSANADYLIEDDEGKYFYWRYINNNWKLISGAGGGGTGSSSGEFAAALTSITTPDINTDYFVGNNTVGYTHYRYVIPTGETEGDFVRILPKGLITDVGTTVNGGLTAHTLEDPITNVFSNFVVLKDVSSDVVQKNGVDTTVITFIDTNGISHEIDVVGGGGGSAQTVRLNNTLSSLNLIVPDKEGVVTYLRAKAIVKDGSEIDTNFSAALNVATQYTTDLNGTWTNFTTQQVQNNVEFSVNISSILQTGIKTYVRLVLTTTIEEATVTRTIIYEVSKVEMSISAVNFNPGTVRTTDFNFAYRCMGSGLTKTIHFLIDDVDAVTPVVTTLHNDRDQQMIPVNGLTAGMHSFKVYFTVDDVQSNILNYYILYNNDSSRVAPIIALAAENDTITYGDDLKINYTVATAGLETTDEVILELYTIENSTEHIYSSTTLANVINETVNTWRPTEYPESGVAYIRATAIHTVNNIDYSDTKTIQIAINELQLPEDYSLEPKGTESLLYSYTAYGRSNNDVNKETYHYTYHAITGQDIEWTGSFNNFNWSGDGYVDGQSLTISGGATHTIDITPFLNSHNNIKLENTEGINDISRNGRTIEIEYEVQSATDLNDVIINCMSNITTTTSNGVTQIGGTGFQITPQSCYLLKNGSTVNTDDTGFIINESDIAAAYLTPGVRTHLAFVIEPWSDTLAYDQSYHQSVNIYVNGEFANACPYVRGTDDFASNATIRIGSSSCIIKLYQVKVYNRGLSHGDILQNYKVAPATTSEKLARLDANNILDVNNKVDYEKARTKYTCLLLTGPAPITQEGVVINPTVSPYKGYPSPANRKDKKTGEVVGKTESGLILTKPNPNVADGFVEEFHLTDTIPTDQNIEVPAYMGARGAYVSSNNVQGTSSQKYPVHNLKVYLAKWQGPKTTTSWVALEENEEVPEGTETKVVTYKHVANDSELGYELVEVEDGEDTTGLTLEEITYKRVDTVTPAEIKKVKYSLKGKDEHGDDIGSAESTLCWKADYMSTDHANTFNANIADGLFTDTLPGASWGSKHQNTVYGIRCLLFQKQGNNPPEFLGDGCLNNDKGNNKTYDLERDGDDGNDTASQKWEFTNNSDDLGYFKTDTIFKTVGEGANAHIQAKDAFESTFPDEGDLKDDGLEPNYNHLQILLTWLSNRANYWDETNPSTRADKKQIFIEEFTDHINMDHALTYYLFSEYVALCDNRVKNMFLRSDNVKSEKIYQIGSDIPIFDGNSNPNAAFFQNIESNRNQIDWSRSTFAVWAPVLYDLDSCFGVENVGYIRVRYDADWDYTWNGAPQFNGYESRLWLQFADCFDNEIKAAALALYDRQDGLNYTNFYRQQITGNLNCISPALSNQDMLVKFDKPWSEGFMNYSLAEPAMETPYYKYLQRGSRTAQKTQFMSMRSKLLSSKYGAKEFTNDSIKFRTGVPVGASGNIIGWTEDETPQPIYGDGDLTETKITVTANQAMYPGIAYGDNKAPTRSLTNGGKVNAGVPCDIQATSAVQGNDGIFICGASILTDIGDLSKFRPYQIDVGAGVNLKRLIVGSNAEGYTNNNTDTLMNLNKCVLLEEINIRNCSNVSTLNLQNNPLIKKVYAAGSGTTTLIFPNGGVLDTVEYSAVTGNITLRNQSNLVNFSYENSQSNHYSSLTKLWIENTPNVPIIDIINTRLERLTAGVRLVGLDINLYADATTQEEINAASATTTLFLNTLVSDIAKGKYLDSDGAFTPDNTNYPYITGKVRVTSIRASLLAKLNTLYPNLVIYNTIDSNGVPSNNIITEYTITYQNYDGTVLYTDYRTGDEHYMDPVYDINPITGHNYLWNICPPDGIPKKPNDVQYQYFFGTYTNETYDRYSGWVRYGTTTNPIDDDYVSGNTTFIAYYPTTITQRYTVTWYEEPTEASIKSYTDDYGIDISTYESPEEAGAVARVKIKDGVKKVFKGWDRPVGKLTGNINVYAQWETSTIDNAVNYNDINMSTLNAADLYAISLLGDEAKRRILEDRLGTDPIFIRMGHDFDYTSGVTTYNLLNGATNFQFASSTTDAKIYDGAHGLGEIRPLSINSDWTLAIDYKFLLNSTVYAKSSEFVLASCYKEANSTIQGFKLALKKNSSASNNWQAVEVSWGTATVTIDYLTVDTTATDSKLYAKSYRNVVVLSHNAKYPEQLLVYYLPPALDNTTYASSEYGGDYGTKVVGTKLTWPNVSNFNAPLILGGNYAGETTEIESSRSTRCPAKGIIYWAKYWDAALGSKNCEQLAAWPHETVPFYLSGYNNNQNPSRQIVDMTELSFIAAQGLGDRYVYTRSTELAVPIVSWRDARLRTLCNGILYNAMPVAYQSIIRNTAIESVAVNINTTSNNLSLVTTNDYLYLPAEREVTANISPNIYKVDEIWDAWNSPWPWMQATNINNWYIESGVNTLTLGTAPSIAPFLYRFSGAYIAPTARIYRLSSDPYNNGGTWSYNNTQISVRSGDVWVTDSGVAYIYYTNNEINTHGIYVDLVNNGGGWKKAEQWNIRTYNIDIQTSSEFYFEYIDDTGVLEITPTPTVGRYKPRLLCPEFSI